MRGTKRPSHDRAKTQLFAITSQTSQKRYPDSPQMFKNNFAALGMTDLRAGDLNSLSDDGIKSRKLPNFLLDFLRGVFSYLVLTY